MNVLIIGGTGTLGRQLVERFYGEAKVTVFSRDEYKQTRMKKVYPEAKFILGDIRDWVDLTTIDWGAQHAVFHCAALKHVDVGENQVDQFTRTNYFGSVNVMRRCLGKCRLVFFSTDKAVQPVNAYGMSKALAEKYIQQMTTEATIFRWGNILGSRGSILDHFAQIIQAGGEVPITDLRMTRFWLTINEVIDYVMSNYIKGVPRKPMIPQVKGAKVTEIAMAIGKILDKPVKMKVVGIRPGEKLHECLEFTHDFALTSDTCEQFEMDELIVKIRQVMKQ